MSDPSPNYRCHLDPVLKGLMQKAYSAYAGQTKAKMDDRNRAAIMENFSRGIDGLVRAALEARPPCTREPPGPTRGQVHPNWMDIVLAELARFNANGVEYIGSCSEALLKAHGIMNVWFSAHPRSLVLYRGETNYGWELIPRVGRGLAAHDPDKPLTVTKAELSFLQEFQDNVLSELALQKEVFGESSAPDQDDPTWWALMQHYDEKHGTRMIDVTTSIFCGLYFACASWDGAVDESIDGALYLFPGRLGRGEEANAPPHHYDDPLRHSARDYFDVLAHPDIVRFREARGRNDRLIAQDGFLLWQPKFEQPLVSDRSSLRPFKFCVCRSDKKRILCELYSTGYTARRIVRGERGKVAHQSLCDALGLNDS